MRIELHGKGKMGKLVEQLALLRGHEIGDKGDVSIDFSVSAAVIPHLKNCLKRKIPLVIGTTGWNVEEGRELVERLQGTALYAPNFSLGVAYFTQLLEKAIGFFPHAERAGLELHHSEKKDSPSGTAKALSTKFAIPFTSLRIGSCMGKHEVMLETESDRITLTHEAKSRKSFALGAIEVAEWIVDQKGWLTLDDYLHRADYALHR